MVEDVTAISTYQVGTVMVHRIIDWLGGLCPVQAEGTVAIGDKQYPWYFKSRGDKMYLEVTLADNTKLSATKPFGIFPDAGYITDEVAVVSIDELLTNLIRTMESKNEG